MAELKFVNRSTRQCGENRIKIDYIVLCIVCVAWVGQHIQFGLLQIIRILFAGIVRNARFNSNIYSFIIYITLLYECWGCVYLCKTLYSWAFLSRISVIYSHKSVLCVLIGDRFLLYCICYYSFLHEH